MIYIITLLVLLTPIIWSVLSFYWSVLKLRHIPPGPFPLPLLGNLHLIRHGNIGESLKNLARNYGDLMTVYFGHKPTVIVGSPELAREVLVRQSTIFGGRPTDLPYAIEMFSRGCKNMAFRPNLDSSWKKQRKLFLGAMKSFGTNFQVLEKHICSVLEELIETLGKHHQGMPRDIGQDIPLSTMNIICTIVFGSKYNQDDEEFRSIVKAFHTCQHLSSPGQLFDVFPLLRKLPLKKVLVIRNDAQLTHSIANRKYHEHESTLDDDNIRDLTDALLKQHRSDTDDEATDGIKLTEEEVQLIVDNIFAAGFHTSSISILWGIYYLCLNPDIQERAYEEMRRVLEPNELPTFRDRRRLAFCQAIVTEVFRLSSILPLLLPHRAVADAVVSGYHIPADTTIMVNAWAIHHDPRLFPDPHTFNPARFIGQDGNYSPPSPNTFFPFSAGKRVCVGEALGKMVVFLLLARLLYNYRFSLASDENVESSKEEPSLLVSPKHFEVIVERR